MDFKENYYFEKYEQLAVLAVYEIFNAKSVLGGYGNISIGAYLLLLAAIGLVAGIFLVYNNTKKQQN